MPSVFRTSSAAPLLAVALSLSPTACGAGSSLPETDAAPGANGAPDSASDAPSPPERSACTLQDCASLAQAVDITATSPYGPMQLESASVRYVSGFTNHTDILLEGTVAGEAATLQVMPHHAGPAGAFAIPPGEYVGVRSQVVRSDEDGLCAYDELATAVVTIDTHVPPIGVVESGATVLLEGRVRILEAGWDLDVPFAITVVCDYGVDK